MRSKYAMRHLDVPKIHNIVHMLHRIHLAPSYRDFYDDRIRFEKFVRARSVMLLANVGRQPHGSCRQYAGTCIRHQPANACRSPAALE